MKIYALVLALIGLLLAMPYGLRATATIACAGIKVALDLKTAKSQTCLSCHDGAVASTIQSCNRSLNITDSGGNHPVMVSYEGAYNRNWAKFVTPSILDSRINLIEGEVHCVSCHAVSPNGKWELVKRNDRSMLCLSCHRK